MEVVPLPEKNLSVEFCGGTLKYLPHHSGLLYFEKLRSSRRKASLIAVHTQYNTIQLCQNQGSAEHSSSVQAHAAISIWGYAYVLITYLLAVPPSFLNSPKHKIGSKRQCWDISCR